MKGLHRLIFCLGLVVPTSSCSTVNFGSSLFDSAGVMIEASEIKRRQSAFEDSGDRLRLESCTTSAYGY